MTASRHTRMLEDDDKEDSSWFLNHTHLATGPIMLKISKSIDSVTVGSSSPT